MESISFAAAFGAGVISFLSPCVLPLVPGYLSFVSGVSIDQEGNEGARKRMISHSLAFIAGFSLVFILLGASATVLGHFLVTHLPLLTKLAGLLVILFGLHTMELLPIPWLYREKRFHFRDKPVGLFGSALVGVAFAFGWTPCIGPILAAILAYAGTQETVGQGILLLTVYSLGLGIPFFLTSLGLSRFYGFFGWLKRHMGMVQKISGLLLIAIGFLIISGSLSRLASYFPFLQRFAM